MSLWRFRPNSNPARLLQNCQMGAVRTILVVRSVHILGIDLKRPKCSKDGIRSLCRCDR
jgi:hypothetical protein